MIFSHSITAWSQENKNSRIRVPAPVPTIYLKFLGSRPHHMLARARHSTSDVSNCPGRGRPDMDGLVEHLPQTTRDIGKLACCIQEHCLACLVPCNLTIAPVRMAGRRRARAAASISAGSGRTSRCCRGSFGARRATSAATTSES